MKKNAENRFSAWFSAFKFCEYFPLIQKEISEVNTTFRISAYLFICQI